MKCNLPKVESSCSKLTWQAGNSPFPHRKYIDSFMVDCPLLLLMVQKSCTTWNGALKLFVNNGMFTTVPSLTWEPFSPEFRHPSKLVGGFNPWESSPNRGEHKKYLKPPPRKVCSRWSRRVACLGSVRPPLFIPSNSTFCRWKASAKTSRWRPEFTHVLMPGGGWLLIHIFSPNAAENRMLYRMCEGWMNSEIFKSYPKILD